MTTDNKLLETLSSSGVTQRELAELIGVSRVTVNRWIKGYSQPSPAISRVLVDILNLLDVAVERGLLPGGLPPAHGKTVETRRHMLSHKLGEAKEFSAG